MRGSKKAVCLALGWAALFAVGTQAVEKLSAGPKDAAALTKSKNQRITVAVRNNYVRCLKLSYAPDRNSRRNFEKIASACVAEAETLRAGFVRAGFHPQRASNEINGLAAATYQKMLRLMPPCPEEMPLKLKHAPRMPIS